MTFHFASSKNKSTSANVHSFTGWVFWGGFTCDHCSNSHTCDAAERHYVQAITCQG